MHGRITCERRAAATLSSCMCCSACECSSGLATRVLALKGHCSGSGAVQLPHHVRSAIAVRSAALGAILRSRRSARGGGLLPLPLQSSLSSGCTSMLHGAMCALHAVARGTLHGAWYYLHATRHTGCPWCSRQHRDRHDSRRHCTYTASHRRHQSLKEMFEGQTMAMDAAEHHSEDRRYRRKRRRHLCRRGASDYPEGRAECTLKSTGRKAMGPSGPS